MMSIAPAARSRPRRLPEAALLPLVLVGAVTWQLGATLDTWFHRHVSVIDTFFTWAHALLYAGWLITGALVVAYLLESLARGEPRARWLPPGFPLVLLGAALFGVGGVFDFAWHAIFGSERLLEAFFSPSHLILLLSSLVSAAGLLRAAVLRRAGHDAAYRPAWRDLPVLIGLGLIFRTTMWALIYSQPTAIDYAAGGTVASTLWSFKQIDWQNTAAQVSGIDGLLLYSILLVVFVILPLPRLRLPGGSIAAILLWEGVLIAATTDAWRYLPAVAGAALLGEALWAALWRGRLGGLAGRAGYWVLAAAVPTAFAYLYFALTAAVGGGLTWTTHLWAGVALLAGVYGFVTALVAIPPAFLTAPAARR